MKDPKFTIDAENRALGRVASEAASILMGKDDPAFLAHLKKPRLVEIINSSKAKITGKKLLQKKYKRYSGYHSGLRLLSLGTEFSKRPSEVMRRTVWGMLPKNKLRRKLIKNLQVAD